MARGTCSVSPPHTILEGKRRLFPDTAVCDEFVVKPEGHAVPHLEPRDGRHRLRAFLDANHGFVFTDVVNDGEHGVRIEARIGDRRYPGRFFGDEESVRVQPRRKSRIVNGVYNRLQALPAAGVHVPVDLEIAEAECVAAVQVDLAGAHAPGGVEPLAIALALLVRDETVRGRGVKEASVAERLTGDGAEPVIVDAELTRKG